MKKENQNLILTKYPKGYSVKGEAQFLTGIGEIEIYTNSKNKKQAISIFYTEVNKTSYTLA